MLRPNPKNTAKGGWWDRTWSPIAMRCTKISPACDSCWHLSMCKRLAENPRIKKDEREAYAGLINPVMTDRLADPWHWKKPAVIATQLMGDLFHDRVTYEDQRAVMAVINAAPQHLFILCTKRAERMFQFFERLGEEVGRNVGNPWKGDFPFTNVMGLVTTENQETADERIPWLARTPVRWRGISAEPLLGGINLDTFTGHFTDYPEKNVRILERYRDVLDLVIAGGENAAKPRPTNPYHLRKLRNQCVESGTAFWFKGWGGWAPWDHVSHHWSDGFIPARAGMTYSPSTYTWRIDKDLSGRVLDGRTWEEFPDEKNFEKRMKR